MATGFPAVVFDFFGTLTPGLTIEEVEASMARVASGLGADPSAFAEAMRHSWSERSIGALGDSRETLRTVASRVGVEPDPDCLTGALGIRLTDFKAMAQLRPAAAGVLARLRQCGIRICVVSDCPPELAELWPELPVSHMVDGAVLSAAIGIKKPAAEMFLSSARIVGVDPTECLYVGDGGSNELSGASHVGMSPVAIVDPEAEPLYVHDLTLPGDVPVIISLEEVVALTGCDDPGDF